MDTTFADDIETKPQATIRKFIHSIKHLHKTEAIMSNLIALGFCFFIMVVLQIKWLLPQLNHYYSYVMVAVGVLAAIQVIRSARHSLLFPTLCLTVSLPLLISGHYKWLNLGELLTITQSILGLGVLGLCRMILNIR